MCVCVFAVYTYVSGYIQLCVHMQRRISVVTLDQSPLYYPETESPTEHENKKLGSQPQ